MDLQPIVAVLCTRTKSTSESDWSKLVQLMKFLNMTKNDVLTLSTGKGIMSLEWFIDVAFAVHPDFKSHSGMGLRFRGGKGCLISGSEKQ